MAILVDSLNPLRAENWRNLLFRNFSYGFYCTQIVTDLNHKCRLLCAKLSITMANQIYELFNTLPRNISYVLQLLQLNVFNRLPENLLAAQPIKKLF